MREPRPDWSLLWVNFKILDEHPHLFIFESPPGYQGEHLLNMELLPGRGLPYEREGDD